MKEASFLLDIRDTWHQIYTDLPQSRRVKREWIKKGYTQQMSLYGVITEVETQESEYRRIEILSNEPYSRDLVANLYLYFQQLILPFSYTIWIWDKTRRQIKNVGRFR